MRTIGKLVDYGKQCGFVIGFLADTIVWVGNDWINKVGFRMMVRGMNHDDTAHYSVKTANGVKHYKVAIEELICKEDGIDA